MAKQSVGRVFRRTWTKDGTPQESEFYYYDVTVSGRRYRGRTPCRVERDAKAWLRDKATNILDETETKRLVEKHRGTLSGRGGMRLDEAWQGFLDKPRRRSMTADREAATKSRWDDFVKYAVAKIGRALESILVVDIERPLAEAYVNYIRTAGKWDKTVSFRRKGKHRTVAYTSRLKRLSNNTCNDFLQTCRMVFAAVVEDVGCENPFAGIDKLPVSKNQAKRQPYTAEQLRDIGKQVEGPLKQLFVCGISTGFREGDICLLEWENVNPSRTIIERELLKTRVHVRLPIMPGLRAAIEESEKTNGGGKYVFPELATLYLNNRTGVGAAVKRMFADMGIESRKTVPGRDRKVSVLDVHSLRHTFAYLAGLHNIPLPVVQSIVGHMTPEMTRAYMDHANDQDKATELAKLPDYLSEGDQHDVSPMQRDDLPRRAMEIVRQFAARHDMQTERVLSIFRSFARQFPDETILDGTRTLAEFAEAVTE